MVLVVGGMKGGSGKTTVATNLCVMRALAGKDVLLVDADEQATASEFTLHRNLKTEDHAGYTSVKITGRSLRPEVLRLLRKHDDVIIDAGGRDTTGQRGALSLADIALIPFVPRSFDVWTIMQVSEIVGEMKTVNHELLAYTFLNRADSRGQDNADAIDVLKDSVNELLFIDTPLRTRKAFSNAASDGLAVIELTPGDSKAADEVLKLYRFVFGEPWTKAAAAVR